MKVLHIINNLGSGGSEKLIEDILPLFNKEKNIEAEVLLLTDENSVFEESLKEKGVNVEVIPIRKIKSLMNVIYIKKYIIDGKYDIVHSHLFPTLYWVSMASKIMFKNRPKFIHTEHSTHNRRREKKFLKLLEKKIYSEFDRKISISQSTQENLVEWIQPKEKDINKFIVINNGIDVSKFKNAKSYRKKDINKKFNDETKLICMAGSFSKQKDQTTLIKAMKNLPNDIHLLLVGEGPLKKQNEKLANDIGALERIHFLGFRRDVERIYKTSDIVVLSSHWEGFGLAAVEGMASEKAVIASKVIGVKEIVEGYGLIFEEKNVDELSNIIIKLFSNKSFYDNISKKCFNRAKRFDIDKMTYNYVKVYREILNSHD